MDPVKQSVGQKPVSAVPKVYDLRQYIQEVNSVPMLSIDEEIELGTQVQSTGSAEARAALLRTNVRLVISIAEQYTNRGVPLAGLIEVGNAGLAKSIEEFDPSSGVRLSTRANWWIRQAMKRLVISVPSQSLAAAVAERGESSREGCLDVCKTCEH